MKSNFLQINNTPYKLIYGVIFTSKKITSFNLKFLEYLEDNSKQENFNINITFINEKYFYSGYPSGNYLKIFCKVFELWAELGHFPISFHGIDNIEVFFYHRINPNLK